MTRKVQLALGAVAGLAFAKYVLKLPALNRLGPITEGAIEEIGDYEPGADTAPTAGDGLFDRLADAFSGMFPERSPEGGSQIEGESAGSDVADEMGW